MDIDKHQPGTGPDPLATLFDLAHRARHAGTPVELDFLAVNGSHALAPYRQAALWFEDRGVCALSGVVQIEANAPYVHWLGRLAAQLGDGDGGAPRTVSAADLDASLAGEWAQWLPGYALWLPIAAGEGGHPARGGLLLARDIPWLERELPLLAEWADILRHAWLARTPPLRLSPRALRSRLRRRRAQEQQQGLPWWRRRVPQALLAAAVLLCLPVRLSVLAPGELVPANAVTVRSPLDGVIERFEVAPNGVVRAGQPLFHFDRAQLESRDAVAAQALATAEAEYRQALQQALADGKSRNMLATLQGRIEERRAEAAFMHGQLERATVLAPRDGVALFDDPSEWTGRPVATGERIMRIASPREIEVEAWLPLGDAIPLEPGAPVSLYLASSPLDAVEARLRYVAYEAVAQPDGSWAYRVRATLPAQSSGADGHRVGLKGSARLSGGWVPLAYWMLRRPLAAVRQAIGI
ncbi:efflux RND transporter periplasmic adaptor subunit [Massilia sp. MS-15]|uniref:efflux RND transporter periplasmic adaptor subunit n=1 Tax=Massilia sp. MS-15 TaxID=2878200 RepID=UPI001CD4ECDE|nr:HlyD family secretion protein [Massilia sp. MS-15]MCA1245682.1 HlyD family efflux transporter periplasmic adaptor subunit [Massilia sp. MS-15]